MDVEGNSYILCVTGGLYQYLGQRNQLEKYAAIGKEAIIKYVKEHGKFPSKIALSFFVGYEVEIKT